VYRPFVALPANLANRKDLDKKSFVIDLPLLVENRVHKGSNLWTKYSKEID
jgi:hypothetical protein